MKRRLDGIIRLSRFKEYFFFVIITTLMGVISGNGEFGWRLVGVLFANWLSVAFAFMVNDIEDAADDALNPEKVNRNPVSAMHISKKLAWNASFVVAGISALLFLLLGTWPFILGMLSLVVGLLYSWEPVRWKSKPLVDLLSHGMMLAGFQFLTAYFSFGESEFLRWFFPFQFLVCISLYGELFNEIRDLDGDLAAGLNHTGCYLGKKVTTILMFFMMALGVIGGFISFFVLKLIPLWVFVIIAILAVVFNLRTILRYRRGERSSVQVQNNFQKPFEIAMAFGLLLLLIGPWVLQTLNLTQAWANLMHTIGL
jgi:4-hydroxybenzoate polyprenyltransferase